jgi:hypothetical protein
MLMNAWDIKFKEYRLHSEDHVSKYMMGHIEWSLAIGIWLDQRWLLHWVRLWMLGSGTPDPRNMFRECLRLHLPDPRTSTFGSIIAQIMATNQEIKQLSKDAPALCQQHLLDLITDAEQRDDMQCTKAIQGMLEREAQKK